MDLSQRAADAGVATSYLDWARRRVDVAPAAVEATLELVGPPARPALVTAGPSPVAGNADAGVRGDGRRSAVGEPLPTGVHLLADGTPVVVGPPALPPPDRRTWGWQVQLYQLRSARSWGIGDYADLRTLAREIGARGADVLLVNPMHAVTPVLPIQPSPYFPSSRRFADQVGVAVDALPEYAAAPAAVRARVDALRPPSGPLIDRDAVWTAKRAAFALLLPRTGRSRQPEVDWTGARRVRGLLARWPSSTARTGGPGRSRCGGRVRRRPPRPTRSWSGCTGGSSSARSSSWTRRSRKPATPGWRSGSCTTWPSASTRSAPTPGCCRATWPPARRSGRRRTRSGSSGRTGGSRRSGRGGWPRPRTGRSGRSCGRRWSTAAGCGSTT